MTTKPYPHLTDLVVSQVVHVPEKLQHGTLYASKRFETLLHLCPCGCGEKTVTPQHPTKGWVVLGDDTNVTLRPSILNPVCKAHYYVTDNRIEWL